MGRKAEVVSETVSTRRTRQAGANSQAEPAVDVLPQLERRRRLALGGSRKAEQVWPEVPRCVDDHRLN